LVVGGCHGPNAIESIKQALLYMKDKLKKEENKKESESYGKKIWA
jgi:hypothetical protein